MADDGSDFARSMSIATSGLRAQAGRMRVISENIANADSTAPTSARDPYRRKVPTFSSALDRSIDAKVVTLGKVRTDQSAFRIKYEPSNPAADAAGNVKYPNVNPLVEMTDMREAQRSYEANLNIISATRRMIQRTLDILKALNRNHKPWLPRQLLQMPTPRFRASWRPAVRRRAARIRAARPSARCSRTPSAASWRPARNPTARPWRWRRARPT